MRIVSMRIIAFSEIFDVRQYTLMDAMDQHVGPERPVELREDLVFVPSATFQTCTSVPEIDQSEFPSFASKIPVEVRRVDVAIGAKFVHRRRLRLNVES
jgi:hypothetical protein